MIMVMFIIIIIIIIIIIGEMDDKNMNFASTKKIPPLA